MFVFVDKRISHLSFVVVVVVRRGSGGFGIRGPHEIINNLHAYAHITPRHRSHRSLRVKHHIISFVFIYRLYFISLARLASVGECAQRERERSSHALHFARHRCCVLNCAAHMNTEPDKIVIDSIAQTMRHRERAT